MTVGARGSTLAGLGVLGLFLIAMLAAVLAGPPPLPASSPRTPRPLPSAQESLLITAGPSMPPETRSDGAVLLIVGIVLGLLVCLVVVIAVVRLLPRLIALIAEWMRRPAEPETTEVATEEHTSDPAQLDAPRVQRGIATARQTIGAHRDAGDAIVAAWLGLEQTAADSGVGRGRSETPAEFALRLLLRRPGIDEPARSLLALYEQVRFGGRRGDERMREDATRALDAIEAGWR